MTLAHSVRIEDRRVVVQRNGEVVASLSFSEVCMAANALREYAESITPVDPVPALRTCGPACDYAGCICPEKVT